MVSPGREIVYPAATGTKLLPSAAGFMKDESLKMKSATKLPTFTALAFLLAGQVMAEDLEPGDTFSEEFRDGGQGPEMVVIPAGSFEMGNMSDLYYDERELPVHTVTISEPFGVSKYEITFDEYERFKYPNPSGVSNEGWGRGRRPIIWVNWLEAKEYVAWLSSQTGHTYRLLTEAEWEYAARAGSTTEYHFGDDPSHLCHFANIGDESGGYSWAPCSDGVGRQTSEVGRYAPNAFGLHDMHGNLWEWVEDCSNDDYSGAPSEGSAWLSGDCSKRLMRGGSWLDGPRALRVSMRRAESNTVSMYFCGFRVARTLEP